MRSAGPVTGAKEFRPFICALEDAGELVRVDEEVDWNIEVGARTRTEAGGRNRALLFERIRGYPNTRILSNAMGSLERISIALDLPPHQSLRRTGRAVRARLEHPIAPTTVPERTSERQTYVGDEVDLTALPVPRWAPEDGARYLGTWHINVTRHPTSRMRNVGVYRMQLVDERTALVSASPESHLMGHFRAAEARGEALEMAVAIGVQEHVVLAAAMAVSPETDEFSLAGALAGASVSLCPGGRVGVETPEDAEIVIEGHILCGQRMAEGPFVDYAGRPSENPHALVFRASLLSVREHPILRGAAIGYRAAEDHLAYAILASADGLDFRGPGYRHHLQAACLKAGWYGPFQILGSTQKPFATLDRLDRTLLGMWRSTSRPRRPRW